MLERLPLRPFWSRNRLTFLQIARYQGHARSRFNTRVTPYGRDHHRPSRLNYSDRSPILVAATAMRPCCARSSTVEASGLRVADRMTVGCGQGADRAASVRHRCVAGARRGLRRPNGRACSASSAATLPSGRYAAIVSTQAALLDPVMARLGEQCGRVDRRRRRSRARRRVGDCDEPGGLAAAALMILPRTRTPLGCVS